MFFGLGQTGGANHVVIANYSDYLNFSSAPVDEAISVTSLYLRISRVSTTYSMDYSTNGLGWLRIYNSTIGFTPSHVGLFAGSGCTCYYRFWRQTSTTALDQPLLGRSLTVQ